MSKLDDKSERGVGVISAMMSPEYGQKMRAAAVSGKFASDITKMALSHAFADAWGREGVPNREKSLAVISALVALKQPAELRNHVKIGVVNGLTVADFESLLVQLTPYVGFPCIATAQTAVIEALRETGLDPDATTAEERGLL